MSSKQVHQAYNRLPYVMKAFIVRPEKVLKSCPESNIVIEPNRFFHRRLPDSRGRPECRQPAVTVHYDNSDPDPRSSKRRIGGRNRAGWPCENRMRESENRGRRIDGESVGESGRIGS